MIARIWRGVATTTKAETYYQHFTTQVALHLQEILGHRGTYLLRREADGKVEFLAITLWDSIESIKRFAGSISEVAVIEPEARAALESFDEFVRHYEIAYTNAPIA